MKKTINWLNTKIGQAVFWTVFPVVAFVILSALIKFLMMYFVQFFNEWQKYRRESDFCGELYSDFLFVVASGALFCAN